MMSRSTISVVIVAGACGIAAGTPLAILGGIGRARARLGAIIKGGLYLETLGRVDTVVLDKTGTLTFGQPEVQAVVPRAGVSDSLKCLEAAGIGRDALRASAGQRQSSHAWSRTSSPSESLSDLTTHPACGITAIVGGATVLVGNRALLTENGVEVPRRPWPPMSTRLRRFSSHATGDSLGRLSSPTPSVPRRGAPSQSLESDGHPDRILLTGDAKPVADAGRA